MGYSTFDEGSQQTCQDPQKGEIREKKASLDGQRWETDKEIAESAAEGIK